MANYSEKLSEWWESRAPQEQRTLKIAVPIILLMLLYILLVEPIMSLYFSRKSDYQDAQETLTWLYDQSALVSRMQNGCGNRVFYLENGATPDSLAQTIARRSSINARFQFQNDGVSVVIATAAGNRLLAYLQSLTCNGFQISDLEIQRLNSAGAAVSAEFTALPVALPEAVQ